MTWHILMKDREGQKYTSSPLATRDAALGFACDVLREGDLEIISIEDDRGETVDLGEVTLLTGAAKLRRAG